LRVYKNCAHPMIRNVVTVAERIDAARQDFAGNPKPGGQPFAPLHVEIQPTANCHRTCVFCSHIKRNRHGGELHHDQVDELLGELRELGVLRVAFSGGGEPLFWKEGCLAEAVSSAADFASVDLTSSGDQLWDETQGRLAKNTAAIMRCLKVIYLNIPEVDQIGFSELVKGDGSWLRARALLEGLLELRRTDHNQKFEIHVVVVISQFNVDRVGAIDRALVDIGIDHIYYKQYKNFEGRDVSRIKAEDEQLADTLSAIPKSQRSADLDQFIESLEATYKVGNFCWAIRLRFGAIVDPNGDIYLCTPTVGMKEFRIGNISEGFRDVWNRINRKSSVPDALSCRSYEGGCPQECRYHLENKKIQKIMIK